MSARSIRGSSPVHILHRLDGHSIPKGAQEIRAFVPVYNEAARLPWFLDYHRNLGVNRFFIIDNASNDGTVELLLTEPDCHVFLTRGSYAESRCGIAWQNALLDEYGAERWCLILDADEVFVYPGCEEDKLPTLAGFLDHEDSHGIFAFLLDMYGCGRVANACYVPGMPFFETCPYFDKDYRWATALRRRAWLDGRAPFPPINIIGGPRLRCFYPDHAGAGRLRKQIHRLNRLAARVLGRTPIRPPLLQKIPFVRWAGGVRYLSSHTTTPIRLSSVTGALLHFKFFADFHDRVMTVRRGQNFGRSLAYAQYQSEYARYLSLLDQSDDVSFFYSDSVRYRNTAQLVEMGLLRDPKGWRSLVAGHLVAREYADDG